MQAVNANRMCTVGQTHIVITSQLGVHDTEHLCVHVCVYVCICGAWCCIMVLLFAGEADDRVQCK